MIAEASNKYGLSKQTLRNYLKDYLIYQNVAVLAPDVRKEKELTL